jgi:N,N'-diacetylchitobiose phosphorylase
MQYGYFDENAREYVITNPNTPYPWTNYLGSPEYGAIITVNAGGYSFVKSGAMGRILRYTFNQFDEPGRYLYLRDQASGDFWSASWKPVAKPLEEYKTVCRFGMGYAAFDSEYAGIRTLAQYYVPLNETYEVWGLTVTNQSDRDRALSALGYCELSNDSNYEQDLVNLQYTQFISRTEQIGNCVLQHINEYCLQTDTRFFALAGGKLESCTGRREAFLGRNQFQAPQAVMDGRCDNTHCYNGNPCGAIQTALTLRAGESRTLVFLLGNKGIADAHKIMARYELKTQAVLDADLAALKKYWHGKLDPLKINTPSLEFNAMVNTWNAFQCYITVVWSRAASLYYCGQRNGFGYRDTVQDIQGIIHLDPSMAKDRIRFMLSGQVSTGAGLPLVKYTHNPGYENTPDDESYRKETGHPAFRADDALWLFPTVYKYIAETGDTAFLGDVIPYADKGQATVLGHLKQAIQFSMDHMGPHGMPAGLHADWNDCLKLGKQGESVFVAFQLYYAMQLLGQLTRDDAEYCAYLHTQSEKLKRIVDDNCLEDDRYIRGFRENGDVIGSKAHKEASMWLNPQSWSVISGCARGERGDRVMQTACDELNTAYGVRLMAPPYRKEAFDGAAMILFNPGAKENGSIFCQPQGWAIFAEALLGHGDRAFQYFSESSPASFNANADVRVIEPYAHGQFIESVESPYFGRCHVHWLTGTASTVMVGCVEGILGLRPTPEGIEISPSIPSAWDGFTMEKLYRGKTLHVTVRNPEHHESGVKVLTVNGKRHAAGLIRFEELDTENEIIILL